MTSQSISTPNQNAQNEKPINILLYGFGAVGAFYAFILARTPTVRLTAVARSNFDAVKRNGLLIRSENHGEHLVHPYAVCRDTAEVANLGISHFDFVVCANKATDLEGTVSDLRPVISMGGDQGEGATTIVLMQNGVGNEDPFHAAFPRCTILSGVIWVGATQDSPGIVRQHISESTTLGIFTNPHTPPSKQQTDLIQFTTLLTNGKHPHIISPTIQTPRWKKCIWNAAWNSLTTLSGVDVHTWLDSSPHAQRTTRRLMTEATAVARALGIPDINTSLADELVDKMMTLHGPVWTSMYHDMRAGRAMEIEVILGTIVRRGQELGVEVPTLETVYALLLAVEGRLENARGEVS